MAKAAFWQRGEALDYTNSTVNKIEANTIVKYGSRIGVVGGDIAPGETGAIHVTGVFDMPLSDAAGIDAGADVYWDGTGITASADNGGNPATAHTRAGFVAAATASGAKTILVKINA